MGTLMLPTSVSNSHSRRVSSLTGHKIVIPRSNIGFYGRSLGCQTMVRQPIEHLVDGIKLVFNGLQLLIKDSLKIIPRSVKNNNAWHGCALYTTPLSSTDRKA
ncbi:hypothetical protein IWW34DRAFT_741999 [Fusarium oxysporum f. sp. albedinis]|nr:hypothetical protein IWW34DRAFT_741999 [Fusarium oxysporum f. sp. albedinis]